MARPARYALKDGTRVPSVTTVLDRFKASGGLTHWAWKCGLQGKSYTLEAKGAADIGTQAHRMVEAYLSGAGMPPLEDLPEPVAQGASIAYRAFKVWADKQRIELEAQEHPLVSPTFRYAGTLDAVVRLNNQRVLVDWKSSSKLYVEHVMQLAAYRNLWLENYPDKPLEGYCIGHLPKVPDRAFRVLQLGDLKPAWEMFLHLLEAYKLDKVVEKML